ncbi:hypothetical protein BJ322DRAFT_1170142 [Thelephora terrestris]|uniref:Uncharacterized protein n=1 Tax=Thelephora terrestris TaxID=56493 RepID=A0A9P6LBD9_9AGAM|nr:hypothetical protein BJ322DRAFT_1170142 [Thelephora terrestris]
MAEDHKQLITRYLTEMKTLFKENKIQPIHHAVLHTGDFLRLFGPTHAAQAFGGERFLEVLGMQNVSNKSGDLEATFTMSVCRSSNLQGILTNANFPQIKPSLDAFHKVADEDLRGTRLADETHYPTTKPPKPVELADDTRAAVARFLNRKHSADRLDKISIRGVIFASEKALRRDSNVIFRRLRAGGDPGPKSNILLVVQEWAVVEDEDARWRYRQFGFAGGFLCWNQAIAIHVVGVDKIISHFARTFFDQRESEHFQALAFNMFPNGSPVQSVCDTATAADSTTSPILVDLDSPQLHRYHFSLSHDTTAVGPVAPHQENENNAVMVVDGSGGPDVKLLKGISKNKRPALMSRLLDRVPLADLHYLSRGDLEQVESYILGLGQGAGLPVDEIDRAAHRLLTASRNLIRGLSQVHKDIATVMRTARDAVDNAVIDYILRHAADEGTQIYELEPLFGLPRHHKVSSEQQRILLAFIEKRWIYSFGENPPSWHAREPTASRHGTQNAQPYNSTKAQESAHWGLSPPHNHASSTPEAELITGWSSSFHSRPYVTWRMALSLAR